MTDNHATGDPVQQQPPQQPAPQQPIQPPPPPGGGAGGGGGGGGGPRTGADQPPPAPVAAAIAPFQAVPAPVTPPQTQLGVGARLAEYLLYLVAGSILVLVIYLTVLDGFTSSEVTHVYDETFAQMRNIAIPHDASGADRAAQILEKASQEPNASIPPADASKVRTVVASLKQSKHLTGDGASRLDQCITMMSTTRAISKPKKAATAELPKGDTTPKAPKAKSETALESSVPGSTSTPDPISSGSSPSPTQSSSVPSTSSPTPTATSSNGAESTAQDDSGERSTAFAECVEVLNPLRQISPSQTADLERLRLMKEYAESVHQHRQAFRSFWLQAAQLVLLNLLLPLLTALLGYIFGSKQA